MNDPTHLSAARSGDQAAFGAAVQPHTRELTLHCYRMLGSLADAEDALQETLLRAWQGLGGFEGRSSLRSWLYKIATNVCLDAIERRRARVLPTALSSAADPSGAMPAPITERVWLEPLPDDRLVSDEAGPDARIATRESVALAFLAMLQTLSGRQRAALVLRDVLGFSANETAETLDTSVAAANSALQRAREALEGAGPPSSARLVSGDADESERLAKLVRAWESGDTSAIIASLAADAVFSMPPLPLWFAGPDAIRGFIDGYLFRPPDPVGRYRVIPARANGSPALGVYERDAAGVGYRFSALDVFTFDRSGRVRGIVAFLALDTSLDPTRFGLPASL